MSEIKQFIEKDIVPLGERIIVREQEVPSLTKDKAGIITANKITDIDKFCRVVLVEIGPESKTFKSSDIGKVLLISKFAGLKYSTDDKLKIIHEADVFGYEKD